MAIGLCPQCGAPVSGQQNYCGACGAQLVESTGEDDASSEPVDERVEENQPDGSGSAETLARDETNRPVSEATLVDHIADDLDEPDGSDASDQVDAPLGAGLPRAAPAVSVPDPLVPAGQVLQAEPWGSAAYSAVSVVPVTSESAKAARQARQVEELRQLEWTPPEDDFWALDEDEQDGSGRAVIVLGIIAATLLIVFLALEVSVITTLAA